MFTESLTKDNVRASIQFTVHSIITDTCLDYPQKYTVWIVKMQQEIK